MLLEHRESGKPALNRAIVEQVFEHRIRDSCLRIIGTVMQLSRDYLGRQIPIVIHGYAHVVPDGRGVLGGRWFLPGPWLSPGFERKGYADLLERREIMRTLMNLFNDMLQRLAALPELQGVLRYVDVRSALSDDLANYRDSWANELHPTQNGFRAVAELIAQALNA
jgi:hypothetical protein